jgi:hydroxymethylpyrimidine kinase/phosphomethylpyrimidine kinase
MSKDRIRRKVCLTIAGLDPSGGAGVIADIKTFSAFECYGSGVVTSITFQNTLGVYGSIAQSGDSVRKQLEPILDDFGVDAVKTGMLPTAEVIEQVVAVAAERKIKNLVVDPVVRSTSGFDLIDAPALEYLIRNLFPLANIVTPNFQEAERIAGFAIRNAGDMDRAARVMLAFGAKSVLIKGGHASDGKTPATALDRFYSADGNEIFESEYINSSSTHGSGCTLSSAIAAGLASGKSLRESIADAKDYVLHAIAGSDGLGRGNSPLNHLVTLGKD